jgi:hypothetical protein
MLNFKHGYESMTNISNFAMIADDHDLETSGWIRQSFIYPDKQLLASGKSASMPSYFILMETMDGKIWFLALFQRSIPTQADLDKVAKTLSCCAAESSSTSAVESSLCDDARIVAQILMDDIESPSSWDSAWKAVFLDEVIRAVSAGSPDGQEIRQRIEQDWSDGIARFVGALDTRAVAMARCAGGLRPTYYNFLVVEDAIICRNRRQASECFPLLLPHLAVNKSYAGIRDVIDRGDPLVEHLAEYYGVAKATVKSLAGLPLSFVASDWQSKVGALLRLLSDIAPEFRPGGPEEWKRFFQTVSYIVRISRMPASTTHNRLRLRACSRTRFRLPEAGLPDVDEVARVIDDFLTGLREALQWEIENALNVPVSELLIQKLINHASVSVGGLDKMQRLGRKYGEIFRREQQSFQQYDRELILGIRWPSPLPDGLTCYQRTIVPLCMPDELMREAQNMKNCVDGYSGRCLRGESQIWSLRRDDGKPMSTLETTIVREKGRPVSKIVQHRAVSNSKPEQECDMAAFQLLKELSKNHDALENYRKWKAAMGGLSRNKREMMVLTKPIIDSLKTVLPGKISFESLVGMGQSLARKREAEECR